MMGVPPASSLGSHALLVHAGGKSPPEDSGFYEQPSIRLVGAVPRRNSPENIVFGHSEADAGGPLAADQGRGRQRSGH